MTEMEDINSEMDFYRAMFGEEIDITNMTDDQLIQYIYSQMFKNETTGEDLSTQEVCTSSWAIYIYKDGNIETIKTNILKSMGIETGNNNYSIQNSGVYSIITKSITGEILGQETIDCTNIIDNDYEFILAEDDENWETDGNGVITKYKGTSTGKIAIPVSIGKEKITQIGPNSMKYSKLTNVIIHDDIVSIGESAFKSSNLTSVTIPGSVKTIGNEAFAETPLTEVIISEGVESIGNQAFFACIGLEKVELPNTLISIGDYAFSIMDSEYFSEALELGRSYDINIPESVLNIGEHSFTMSNVRSINVDSNNKNYSSIEGVLFNKDGTELISYPTRKELTSNYIIPNSVKTVKTYAFAYALIEHVTIKGNVKTLEDGAFYYSALKGITAEEGLESIGVGAFIYCAGLDGADVTLPNSVTNIGKNAFNLNYSGPNSTIRNIYFAPGNNPIPEGRPWGALDSTNIEKLQ